MDQSCEMDGRASYKLTEKNRPIGWQKIAPLVKFQESSNFKSAICSTDVQTFRFLGKKCPIRDVTV